MLYTDIVSRLVKDIFLLRWEVISDFYLIAFG